MQPTPGELPAVTHVSARILNPAGREVSALPEQSLAAGRRTPLWNGKSTAGAAVPPGQYLVCVEARQDGGGMNQVVVPLAK